MRHIKFFKNEGLSIRILPALFFAIMSAIRPELQAAGTVESKSAEPLVNITGKAPTMSYAQAESFLQFRYLPANVIDGNPATAWVSALPQDQLLIGLGTGNAVPHLISAVKLYFGGKDRTPRNYSIKVSLDGNHWETVAVRKNMPYSTERMEYFAPTPGWFVMLDIEKTFSYKGASIREIEVFSGKHNLGETLIEGKSPASSGGASAILSFQTERVLYSPGEMVKAIARIAHPDNQKASRARLYHWTGLGPWKLLKEKTLSRDTNEIMFEIFPEDRKYAHVLKLVLLDNRHEIAEETSLFEVGDDWTDFLRPLAIPAYETFAENYPDEGIAWHIEKLREYYFNAIEFYGGTPCYGEMEPERSPWAVQPRFLHNTFATYERWRDATMKAGIKRIHYNEVLSAWDWKIPEEWLIHTPVRLTEEEKIWTMWDSRVESWNAPARGVAPIMGYPGIGYSPNIASPDYLEYVAKQYAAALERFDFDGLFIDDFTRAAVLSARGSDINGNSTGTQNPAEVASDFLTVLESAGNQVSEKNIVFIGNNLIMGLEGEFQRPDFRQRFLEGKITFPFSELAWHNMIWVHESVTSQLEGRREAGRTNYPYTFKELSRMTQGIKQAGGIKPLLWWDFSFGSPINVKVIHALALANGGGYTNNAFSSIATENNAITDVVKNYLFFAVRYGEFLNDMAITWLPDGIFQCDAPDEVYWSDLAFERTLSPDYKQYYLHLINLPGEDIYQRYNQLTEHKDIMVRTMLPESWKVEEILLLSPDFAHEPEVLPFTMDGRYIHYSIPSLKVWDFIIVNMKR